MNSRDEHAAARKHIVRRATLYSVAFLGAGVVVAVAGSALIAWMISRGRLPFMETWLVVTAIVLLPGVLAAVWKLIRGRTVGPRNR